MINQLSGRMKNRILFFCTHGILLSIIVFNFFESNAQNRQYDVPKTEDLVKIPPSPEAAAFAKYGNTPTNLYTGSPNISIPVASLKGRGIDIPISLSYDASGIKVEQIATWVGLGWNLNVGGMVTRQVNGLPDDYFSSSLPGGDNTFPAYVPFYDLSIAADYKFARDFNPRPNIIYPPGQLARYFGFMDKFVKTNPKYEAQPDTYSFNALGMSGTLFIDYDNEIAYCIESPEIKAYPVIQVIPPYTVKIIVGWRIIDGMGNIFHFSVAEKTRVFENDEQDGKRVYNSAWALTKIETANKRDLVEFNYTQLAEWQQEQLAGRGVIRNDFLSNSQCGIDQMIVSAQPTYQIQQVELSSIKINGITRAQFLTFLNRQDLIGKNALGQIKIFNSLGAPVNTHKFNHTYFGSPSTNEKDLRLRLDNVEVFDNANGTPPQKYSFSYNPGYMPSRESMAQDYWGYYNGQDGNSTLIPYNYDFDQTNVNFIGANRKPNPATTLACSLAKIQYPTGGSTEFYYQPHTLPPNSYSYKEDYLLGSAGLRGGFDPSDPMRYFNPRCDDILSTPPKGTEQSFQVNTPEPTRLKVYLAQNNPNGNQAGHLLFIALYFTGLDGHQVRSFCDLTNNGNTVYQLTQTTVDNYTFETPLNLALGHYRIMIVNSNPDVTATVEVVATRTINVTESQGAGLRIFNMQDKTADGSIASNRFIYYNDLRKVAPSLITKDFIASAGGQNIGTLHLPVDFEEGKSFETIENNMLTPNGFLCSSLFRYGSNRIQSNYFFTYPVVSEISFDEFGNNSGFTVTRFLDNIENHTGGIPKKNVLLGKVTQKLVLDKSGKLVTQERNYYSLNSAAPSTAGTYYYSNKTTFLDLTVKAEVATPQQEFYQLDDPQWSNTGSGWLATHCVATGITVRPFSDDDYHTNSVGLILTGPTRHVGYNCAQISVQDPTFPFNNNHPARVFFLSLLAEGASEVSAQHFNSSGMVGVGWKTHFIYYCKHFSQDYRKMEYQYNRWWAKLDSTVSVQYFGTDSLVSYTRNLYENTNHFQLTGSRKKDSNGILRTVRFKYPHEMQQVDPSNNVWQTFVLQNRITEPIEIESTYANNQRDFLKTTSYHSVPVSLSSILLPNKVSFASGNGNLEDRIQYHWFDDAANPIEISRTNDMRTSFIWGYNKELLIAEAKNGLTTEIFHTSFEAGEEGGNSSVGDARTGSTSKLDGYTKTLSGLTPNKTYVLTYWQKNAGVWTLQTVNIAASTSTSYTINLTGQVDEVRFHPQGTLMTSYTHKPGVGITSVCDPKGLITSFEYDSFSRLWFVKDHVGNILKEHKYHYKQ